MNLNALPGDLNIDHVRTIANGLINGCLFGLNDDEDLRDHWYTRAELEAARFSLLDKQLRLRDALKMDFGIRVKEALQQEDENAERGIKQIGRLIEKGQYKQIEEVEDNGEP